MKTAVRIMLLAAWAAAAMLSTSDSSFGQSTTSTRFSQESLDQYYRAAKRTVNHIIDTFNPQMSSEQKRTLEEIDISISYSEDVYHVFAKRHSGTGQKSIEISLGFIITMEAILDAFIIGYGLGRNHEIMDYVKHITELMRENARRRLQGMPQKVVPYFYQFANVSEHDILDAYTWEEFQSHRVMIKVHALAFVLAHELAHHLRNHLDDGSASYEEEQEADEFALDLGVRAGYSPLFGAWPYMFHVSMEEIAQGQIGRRSHPAAVCRAILFLEEGIDIMLRDREFLNYLEESGLKSEWMDNVRAQQQLVVEECDE